VEWCGIAVQRVVCQCAAGCVLWSGVVLRYTVWSALHIVRVTVICVLLQDVLYHHTNSVVTTPSLPVLDALTGSSGMCDVCVRCLG